MFYITTSICIISFQTPPTITSRHVLFSPYGYVVCLDRSDSCRSPSHAQPRAMSAESSIPNYLAIMKHMFVCLDRSDSSHGASHAQPRAMSAESSIPNYLAIMKHMFVCLDRSDSSHGASHAQPRAMSAESSIPNYLAIMKHMFAFAYVWGFGSNLHDR